MKKVILMLVMLAFTVAGYAGDVNKKVKVSSFNGLDISSYFEVTLEKGAQSSVNITVDEELEPYIIAKVNGNVLYLGLRSEDMPRKLRNNNGNRTLKAHITMPTLRKLDLSGATSFSTNDSFDEKEFEGDFSGASEVKNLSLMVSDAEFDISGACDVNLKIDADKCEFDVSGASMLKLNGSIDYLSMDLSGASKCTMNGESISSCDVILDSTPAGVGAKNKLLYQKYNVKAIFQGGEDNSVADVFFHGYANYEKGLGKDFLKLTSCN